MLQAKNSKSLCMGLVCGTRSIFVWYIRYVQLIENGVRYESFKSELSQTAIKSKDPLRWFCAVVFVSSSVTLNPTFT